MMILLNNPLLFQPCILQFIFLSQDAITLLPSQLRGTMILAELPNSLAIAVISDT